MKTNPINSEKESEAEISCPESIDDFQPEISLMKICALANSHDGLLRFRMIDNGAGLEMSSPEQAAQAIENQIRNDIQPQPACDFAFDPSTGILSVFVHRGQYTPYRYRGKAYCQNGSSTVEADDYNLLHLILRGRNQEFCDLPAKKQDLSFEAFSSLWKKHSSLSVSRELLCVLGAAGDEGLTITAELLSDQNGFPGVSIVKFGKTISQIESRRLFEKESVLSIWQKALQLLLAELSYQEITDHVQKMKTRVPESAVRKVLTSAILYRDWSIPAPVQIEIHSDRLCILIPGGLPESMTEDEYLYSEYTIPRNTQLAIIFQRLHLTDLRGSGPGRIRVAYEMHQARPVFTFFQNSVSIELPFTDRPLFSNPDLSQILQILKQFGPCRRKEIERVTGFSQTKTIRLLRILTDAGQIEKAGAGPSTIYRLA